MALLHIDGGISQNAWAVDRSGSSYFQDGLNWRFVSSGQISWVTSGESGVWALDGTGRLFFRRGVAPLAPKGIDWKQVPSQFLYRIDSGPMGAVLALDFARNLLLRQGITPFNPTGTEWKTVGSGYKHLSVGSYGYWAVNDGNEVFFATISKQGAITESLRWTRVSGRLSEIKAGFGSSLWGVSPEGDLYQRKGVNAITPRGLSWMKEGNVKVNGVTTGMSGVFASVQGTNQVITKPGKYIHTLFSSSVH